MAPHVRKRKPKYAIELLDKIIETATQIQNISQACVNHNFSSDGFRTHLKGWGYDLKRSYEIVDDNLKPVTALPPELKLFLEKANETENIAKASRSLRTDSPESHRFYTEIIKRNGWRLRKRFSRVAVNASH